MKLLFAVLLIFFLGIINAEQAVLRQHSTGNDQLDCKMCLTLIADFDSSKDNFKFGFDEAVKKAKRQYHWEGLTEKQLNSRGLASENQYYKFVDDFGKKIWDVEDGGIYGNNCRRAGFC
ncbi:hypothetical protein ACTA71_009164 [Dictyostelium dimigraforme]